MSRSEEFAVSKINVNLNHVKRFYSDSETMLKSSIGLKRGEQALNTLAKQIESKKNEIDKAISENGNQKNKVTSTISTLKRKIGMLKIEIKEKEIELSELKSQASFAPTAALRSIASARVIALQAEIHSLKFRLKKCQSVSSELETTRRNLEACGKILDGIKTNLINAKSDVERTRKELSVIQSDSQKCSERACNILQQIIGVITEYSSLNIKRGRSITVPSNITTKVYNRYPTRTFYKAEVSPFEPNNELLSSEMSAEEKAELFDNQKAFEGAFLYLQQQGVDMDALDKAETAEGQKQILINSGFDEKQAKQIISINSGEFLSEVDGSHIPFYSTSPQTAGDSYEFHRFFVNLRDGKETAKEVSFDLTTYKGRSCTFLGYQEKLKNDRRETDVVRIEGNREIHEELKIGRVYGKEGKEKFRQELYGDDLRLRLYPNQEQEYRIRKNAKNQKCLCDDKEMVKYLCTMCKRHPNRVRVYFNDKQLSLEELEKMSS